MAHVIVEDWQRVLLFVDGKFQRTLEPGRHAYSRKRSTLQTVDMRKTQTLVPGQDVLTRDGVSIRVSAIAVWHVVDPKAFFLEASSSAELLYSAIQNAIRQRANDIDLDDFVSNRTVVQEGVDGLVQSDVGSLGIDIESVAVRDVMLPAALRNAAMEVVKAREDGKAAVEVARAEAARMRSMANTAKLLDKHPQLLQLRTIQAAEGQDATVVLNASPCEPSTPGPDNSRPRSDG